MTRPVTRAKRPAPDFVVMYGGPLGALPALSKRLAEWSRTETASAAIDTGKPTASSDEEAR
jgi:hypothetical protein